MQVREARRDVGAEAVLSHGRDRRHPRLPRVDERGERAPHELEYERGPLTVDQIHAVRDDEMGVLQEEGELHLRWKHSEAIRSNQTRSDDEMGVLQAEGELHLRWKHPEAIRSNQGDRHLSEQLAHYVEALRSNQKQSEAIRESATSASSLLIMPASSP